MFPFAVITSTPTPTQINRLPPTVIVQAPPTIITAAPGTIPAQVTPIEQIATPGSVTLTPLPEIATPVLPAATALPTIASVPQNVPQNPLTRAFALSTSSGAVAGSGFLLPFGATTFARSPSDPNRLAVVDTRGLIYLFNGAPETGSIVRLRTSPFGEPEPLTADTNNAEVVQVAWSPDGRHLAYLIDTERDDSTSNDSINDGVWLLDAQQPDSVSTSRQVFRECPPAVGVCAVNREGEPTVYNSLRFEWNNTSSAILIELDLPDESRRALTFVTPNSDPAQKTPTYRYDYGSWSWDGTRILASGLGEDGRIGLRWLDPATGSVQLIFDSGAQGLWLQNAVQRPDRQIVALGSPEGDNAPQRLYDGNGQPLTGQIGFAKPVRVDWSPDRSAALVAVDDSAGRHYYVAEVNGVVREITAAVAGALAVEWVGGVPPATTDVSAATVAPPGVRAPQSQFGLSTQQQVQVHAPAGVILRAQPSTNAAEVGLLNTYEWVTIIDGPVAADGLIWWQVKAENAVGWAAESNGIIQLLSAEPLP